MNSRVIWILLTILWAVPQSGTASTEVADETMLMFVGEELTVMTVASRRPESPAAAPAIARVVHRAEIERYGYQTLAELLAAEPGFYIAKRSRGSVPYLRGIPDGVLFLYDGVPLSMDLTKSLHPLDQELSLHNIKQVEIVRGPGSVLWGSDAFAGVVNLVPLSGRDRPGVNVGVLAGLGGGDTALPLRGAHATLGHDAGKWHGLLALYALEAYTHDDTYTIVDPIAGSPAASLDGQLDPSRYFELSANAKIGDWLTLSGRLSDFRKRYKLQDISALSWAGERRAPINFLKASASQIAGPSHWVLTAYYQQVRYHVTDVDLNRSQENSLFHTELLWDRRLWQKGLLTAGGSWRINRVDGAFVQDGFLPDYLKPDNTIFVPKVEQADYENRIGSLFVQYRHHFRYLDGWIGGRIDDHSQYDTSASYSFGINWPWAREWRLKSAFGTAYRSPYSSQLFGGATFDPERISTLNLQLAWKPSPRRYLSLTGFASRLSNHIQEDPYGGLSQPSSQNITGLELEGRFDPLENLELFATATMLNAWGPPEKYRAFKYAFLRPDGTRVDVYDNWETRFDTGPGLMLRLGATWRPYRNTSITLITRQSGRTPFSYSQNTVHGYYDQPLLVDFNLRIQDTPLTGAIITFGVHNLLDRRYQIPGVYGPDEGAPLTAIASMGYSF